MLTEIDFTDLKFLKLDFHLPLDVKMLEKMAGQIPDNFKHIETLSLNISL